MGSVPSVPELSMTDPQSVATTYGYDTLNRLHTLTYNNQSPNFVFGYDALSHRNSLTPPFSFSASKKILILPQTFLR